MVGKGTIFGARYGIPLSPYQLYAHTITIGIDYKDFKESIGYTTENGTETHTPVTYLPLSFSYSGLLQDEWGGMTQFSGGVNLSFRGIVADQSEFQEKRYKANANYLFVTAGIQRNQKLPWGMGLLIKLDGQVADQPLIDNEEYAAGGMESVRGYKESEQLGDDAFHATMELSFPDPSAAFGKRKWLQMSPYLFYDVALLTIIDPLPDQDRSIKLAGAGGGLRGSLTKYLEYEFDWGVALISTSQTQRNDTRINFKLKSLF